MTTSDIGVSVAIDNDKHIDEIVGVLREYATITVEKNMVIVCVVGDLEWQNVGFEAVFEINVPDALGCNAFKRRTGMFFS